MSLVLAIEPDHRQATILRRIVREHVRADLVLVDSRDAAVSAISTRIPDVILVTALLSPRDEEELVGFLRGLDGAEHLQTYTIPQLASSDADSEQKNGGGLFGKFRKKRDADVGVGGCDPDHFAEEIKTFLDRATERKSEWAASAQQRKARAEFKSRTEAPGAPAKGAAAASGAAHASTEAGQPAPDSAWSSPFEWRPASERASTPQPKSPPPSMVTNVPLAVVAEDQEAEAARAREAELERLAAEADERARHEAEARARQEEERRREEAERKHADAETAARRKKEEEERRKREEEERKRLEAEAAARRKREEEERRKREEEERKRREVEALARKKKEEEERKRLEAEAAARRKREEEERRRRV